MFAGADYDECIDCDAQAPHFQPPAVDADDDTLDAGARVTCFMRCQ